MTDAGTSPGAAEQHGGPAPVRVAVAHKSRIVTDGLAALLQQIPDIEVSEVTSEVPVFAVDADTPDVLVIDPDLAEGDVETLARTHPDMAMLLIADARDAERNIRLLANGAVGLIDETAGADAVAHAVQAAVRGLGVAPARYIALAATRLTNAFEQRFRALSEDDRALWLDVADGCDYATIAERHFISERTARRHVDSLLERLGVDNRLQAAELAGRVFLRDLDLTTDPP